MQIVDLFIKCHMIFDIKFEHNIAPAMHFIGHYMYNIKSDEFKPTLRGRNLHIKLELNM